MLMGSCCSTSSFFAAASNPTRLYSVKTILPFSHMSGWPAIPVTPTAFAFCVWSCASTTVYWTYSPVYRTGLSWLVAWQFRSLAWTKTSSLPSSGLMNPNPFEASYHLHLPQQIVGKLDGRISGEQLILRPLIF